MTERLRKPIISILAHVDHGKTSLLDYIRNSRVQTGEAGGITQHIGASEVPKNIITAVCGKLLDQFKIDFKLPGLLFIDTPGHAAFSMLRRRGGSLADIAILVIDVTEGIKPQTEEAINILKQYKTPFLIAANKIDKLSGWNAKKDLCFSDAYNRQPPRIRQDLDMKIYELIGQLYTHGVSADLYTRIDDFTKTVSIIPISAKTGEGVSDLITMVSGMTQKYLDKNLHIDDKGTGKGTILEVKEVKGLGTTVDVILYDGLAKRGDSVIIGHPNGAIVTKAKAVLKTSPLKEIRVEKQFINFPEISAASGLKISAPNLENVIPGVPVRFEREGIKTKTSEAEVQKEIEEVQIKTDSSGVIIKADALGSLEALVKTLQDMEIPIKRAEIGTVNKKDIMALEEIDPIHKVIFAFNTKTLPDAEELSRQTKTSILSSDIIYRLVEDYEKHIEEVSKLKEKDILSSVTAPSKLKFLSGFVFRQSKPAIVGMEVLGGTIKTGVRLMNTGGKIIGPVHALQNKGENVTEGKLAEQVAVSIDGAVVGRNIKEDDILYSFILKDEYKILSENLDILSEHEKNTLEEIREIMVKKDRLWDVF